MSSSLKVLKRILRSVTPPFIYGFYLIWLNSTTRFEKDNEKFVANNPFEFEVIDFQYFDIKDNFDLKWGWWSRIYEYEFVLEKIEQLRKSNTIQIHNTCWGYHGTHILFKDELEKRFKNVLNTDLLHSNEPNTEVFNLKNDPPARWLEEFDFVINVSTMEEIRHPHIKILYNLLSMTKIDGYVIATFDIPGLQVNIFEKLLETKMQGADQVVTGNSSPYKMPEHGHLSVGFLVLKRTQ